MKMNEQLVLEQLQIAQTAINVALAEVRATLAKAPDATKVEVMPTPQPVVAVKGDDDPLILNDEWKTALDLLHNGTEHIFVTGEAGTGKSRMLRHFVDNFTGNCAVLAFTGVAALRVNGETIHSFFKFGAHALDAEDIRRVTDSKREKFRTLDLLVIDEVSMTRADLMDAIDIFMRKNGRDPNKAFGGCRVVMFGDLYQLSPISKDKDERKWLVQRYGVENPYFFHAEVWRKTPLRKVELTTIFRQKDSRFVEALNAVRKGSIVPELLRTINTCVKPMFIPNGDKLWLTLTTTNAAADAANRKMLDSIDHPGRTFEALVEGEFDLKNAPTDEQLVLKPGAIVMFVRNNPGAWVNGTMGKVVSVDPLRVEVNGSTQMVDSVIWEAITYQYDEALRKLVKSVKGKFHQIPLRLASAVTIHKAQGLTLPNVIIDMSFGAFAPGQTYVALSRAQSLDGLVLRRAIQERDLIVEGEVLKYMKGEPIAQPTPVQPRLLSEVTP